jgi:hypothetical protein
MFKTNQNKGFTMTFKNGITISVQFGAGNYCERRSMTAPIQGEMKMNMVESKTAEIAIWDKEGACSVLDTTQLRDGLKRMRSQHGLHSVQLQLV